MYLTDTSKGTEVYEAIMEAGQEFNVKPTGPSDIRRIEGAIFNWGADMTYENNPIEMGMERLVAWDLADDACISIAALKRIRDAGVEPKDQRRRDRRRPVPRAQQRQVAGDGRRLDAREGDLGDLLAAPGAQHRVRMAARRALRLGDDGHGRVASGGRGRGRSSRCRSSTRTRRSRSPRLRAGRPAPPRRRGGRSTRIIRVRPKGALRRGVGLNDDSACAAGTGRGRDGRSTAAW